MDGKGQRPGIDGHQLVLLPIFFEDVKQTGADVSCGSGYGNHPVVLFHSRFYSPKYPWSSACHFILRTTGSRSLLLEAIWLC